VDPEGTHALDKLVDCRDTGKGMLVNVNPDVFVALSGIFETVVGEMAQ
jgi:hypothetical protein